MWREGYGFGSPWVAASIAVFGVAFSIPRLVVMARMAAVAAALAFAEREDRAEAPEVRAMFDDRVLFVASRVNGTLLLVLAVLMVYKPGA